MSAEQQNGSVTSGSVLQTGSPNLVAACKLIARHYGGPRGEFAYECFEHINATLFGGELPWPLITWALTPHGGCLGYTQVCQSAPPVIVLHPSLLGGTENKNPWGRDPAILGVCYAYDVLVHECTHVKVGCLGGWRDAGPTSHNNPLWVAEVNRLAPLLGLGNIQAGRSRLKRVPVNGQLTKTGKPATRVARVSETALPYSCVYMFPYALREHLGRTDFYRANVLPFVSSFRETEL
jgi:hypothetical protein